MERLVQEETLEEYVLIDLCVGRPFYADFLFDVFDVERSGDLSEAEFGAMLLACGVHHTRRHTHACKYTPARVRA